MPPVKERTLQEILDVSSNKSSNDITLITHAYEFARTAHEGQQRFSGDPYFAHVAEVGYLLAQAGMDTETISAGLLHDVIEDAHIEDER